jgi:hypothetical protein
MHPAHARCVSRDQSARFEETAMKTYSFVLNFNLPDPDARPECYVDALYEAGCDDATVGIGKQGMVGLDFSRAARDAELALKSAIKDVMTAIPGAALVQAGPDLVGLTDMAEIFGFSRQNMRKYATGPHGARQPFPAPAVLGEPSLWHLAEIASWMKANTTLPVPDRILEVSKAAAHLNFNLEKKRVKRILALA